MLRDDGTVWLNLGDSYAGGNSTGKWRDGSARADGQVRGDGATSRRNRNGNGAVEGVKPKDLIGIPWRVALALQADGWHLRQDIIWHKPNPMPESVRDRCTKAHEYTFLLSKSPKYYYDHDASKEPTIDGSSKRNRRSVWTAATRPFKGAHFATFPPDLIEPCILAGCPEGGTVLDPFGSSGTTAGVALNHNRNAVLCEMNPEYAALVPSRVASIYGKPAVQKPVNDNCLPSDIDWKECRALVLS